MEPDDVLRLRETWEAACHADAPKGACCCCYRAHHHQHQVKTETLQAENARLTEQLRIVWSALQTIRDKYGKVCADYELCHHEACESSIGAWFEADAALAPVREET